MKRTLASAVILIDKDSNEILISQRRDDQIYAGYWEFPGGKIEDGETAEQCAIREVKEEVTVEIDNLSKFSFISEIRKDNHDVEYNIIVFIYSSRVTKDLVSPAEGQNTKWVSYDDICKYNLLPSNISLLENIKKIL